MIKGKDYIGIGCGAMIFNDEGKVFLSKRGKNVRNEVGKWEFPGGGVKFGEKCEDAVKREIKEEHDIDIEVIEFLEVVDHIIPEEKQHWVAPSYIARLISGEAKIMELEKCDEIMWINLSEIDHEMLSLASKSNFLKYIEKYDYIAPTF
jgi:8-oxo-dGTP diphosphatase